MKFTVALSRAREGLYILGNDRDLAARSKMWRTVISTLKEDNCVGNAFPVACHRHRDKVQYVSKPGQLPRIAPDGELSRNNNLDATLNSPVIRWLFASM